MTHSGGRTANVVFYLAILFILFAIAWAMVAEVDQVVRAQAEVEPSRQIQLVQARYPGRILNMRADVGSLVYEGDQMFVLDHEDATSQLKQNQVIIASTEVEVERLIAESNGLEFFKISVDIGTKKSRNEQKRIFFSKKQDIADQIKIFDQQKRRLRTVIETSKSRIEGARANIEFIREEEAIYGPLVSEGIEPRVRLLDLKSRKRESEDEIAKAKLEIRGAEIEIKEIGDKQVQLVNVAQTESQEKLAERRQVLDRAKAENKALLDRVKASRLLAPVTGIVSAVHPSGVGTVVTSGETLAEIIPDSDSLLIKAQILPKDISNVEIFQPSRVSFTAYDFSRYGVLEGEVVNIAQNTTENEKGEVFYEAWVKTHGTTFKKSGITPKILPGMIAQVDILGDKRTVMDYLMAPLKGTASRALTEQ